MGFYHRQFTYICESSFVSSVVSNARMFLLNQAIAQQIATNNPHTLYQVVMPIASAIKPEQT